MINATKGARCALPRHQVTGPISVIISRDVSRIRFQCKYRQVELQFTCFIAFLARVKSASLGDASLYDKHFVPNTRSALTLVVY